MKSLMAHRSRIKKDIKNITANFNILSMSINVTNIANAYESISHALLTLDTKEDFILYNNDLFSPDYLPDNVRGFLCRDGMMQTHIIFFTLPSESKRYTYFCQYKCLDSSDERSKRLCNLLRLCKHDIGVMIDRKNKRWQKKRDISNDNQEVIEVASGKRTFSNGKLILISPNVTICGDKAIFHTRACLPKTILFKYSDQTSITIDKNGIRIFIRNNILETFGKIDRMLNQFYTPETTIVPSMHIQESIPTNNVLNHKTDWLKIGGGVVQYMGVSSYKQLKEYVKRKEETLNYSINTISKIDIMSEQEFFDTPIDSHLGLIKFILGEKIE